MSLPTRLDHVQQMYTICQRNHSENEYEHSIIYGIMGWYKVLTVLWQLPVQEGGSHKKFCYVHGIIDSTYDTDRLMA